jgi:hypothetical protein
MAFDLPPHALDRDLVLNFFWRFSVFECALKREGFVKAGSRDAAEPDWEHFARAITGRFAKVSVPGFSDAREQLRQLAPRRQVVRDGRLGWEPITEKDQESDESFTLRLMKTARNNLCHGGKYPDGPIEEIARNRSILRAALTILDGCYEIHAGVRQWIEQAA